MSRQASSPSDSLKLALPIHIVHKVTGEIVRVVAVPDPRQPFAQGYNEMDLPTEAVIPDPRTDRDILRVHSPQKKLAAPKTR